MCPALLPCCLAALLPPYCCLAAPFLPCLAHLCGVDSRWHFIPLRCLPCAPSWLHLVRVDFKCVDHHHVGLTCVRHVCMCVCVAHNAHARGTTTLTGSGWVSVCAYIYMTPCRYIHTYIHTWAQPSATVMFDNREQCAQTSCMFNILPTRRLNQQNHPLYSDQAKSTFLLFLFFFRLAKLCQSKTYIEL